MVSRELNSPLVLSHLETESYVDFKEKNVFEYILSIILCGCKSGVKKQKYIFWNLIKRTVYIVLIFKHIQHDNSKHSADKKNINYLWMNFKET